MLENVAFRLVPNVLTATMMTTEMPAAIKPYSIAVASVWSFQNRVRSRERASLPPVWIITTVMRYTLLV